MEQIFSSEHVPERSMPWENGMSKGDCPLKLTSNTKSVCGTVVHYGRGARYCCIADYRSATAGQPFRKCI